MTEAPPPCRVRPRVDDTAADTDTLVAMGAIGEPPQPQHEGLFLAPDIPPHDDAA